MPQITLDVVSVDSASPLVAQRCSFDDRGGSIGRDESNTFVLSDKHRRVSRLHAAVSFPEGVPTITNASTSLPITFGDQVLDCGRTRILSSGDFLEIGPYVLRVSFTGVSDPMTLAPNVSSPIPAMATAPVAVPGVPQDESDDPFADIFSNSGSASLPLSASTPSQLQIPGVSANVQFGAMQPVSTQSASDPLGLLFDKQGVGPEPFGQSSGLSMDPLAAFGLGFEPDVKNVVPPAQPQPTRAVAAIIPDDFNPFELPSETDRNSADPLSSMLGGSAGASVSGLTQSDPSIDSLFTAAGSSGPDGFFSGIVAAPSAHTSLDSLLAPSIDNDPLAMFGDLTPSRDNLVRPVRDDLAEIGGAYLPPRAIEPHRQPLAAPALPSVSRTSPGSGPGRAGDALTQAFLKGANLPDNALPNGLTPEVMAMVGSLLRSATAGAVDMLAARTATKLEVQASVTIISTQANNPLKFLPNGDVALQQLLGKQMPGFMRADEAMKDAFDDLRAHEIGVIAGTRAALTEVLGRFDPGVLGERLAKGGLLDSVLPSVRKTKLWDMYLERYLQIRREAEDDFQSIFGRAFVQAYERETTRMKAQKTGSGGNQ